MSRTRKMEKAWEKHEKSLKNNYPCSYQYLVSEGTVEGGNPVNQVIRYAENEDQTYESSLSSLRATSERQRQSSTNSLPDVSDRGLSLVAVLIQVDKLAANGSPSRITVKENLRDVYNRAKNTSGHKGTEAVKQTCMEVGLVMAGERPRRPQMSSVGDDMSESILTAINAEDRIQDKKEVEDEERDEIDMRSEEDEDDEDENETASIKRFWNSHGNFATWAYAKYSNIDGIASEMVRSDVHTSLKEIDDIKETIRKSDHYEEAVELLRTDQSINLPGRTIRDLRRSVEIVENGDAVRRKDILEEVIEDLSDYDAASLIRQYEDGQENDDIASPQDSIDEVTAREVLEGTDYNDVDTLMEEASAIEELDETGNIS